MKWSSTLRGGLLFFMGGVTATSAYWGLGLLSPVANANLSARAETVRTEHLPPAPSRVVRVEDLLTLGVPTKLERRGEIPSLQPSYKIVQKTTGSAANLALPVDMDIYSDDELRRRSRNGDIASMLALSERLFAEGMPLEGHNEGFDLLDEAGARGSTEAVKRRGEELLQHVMKTTPDLDGFGLALYQEVAASYLVAAMMMGDQSAMEGITNLLPANMTSDDFRVILRGGYFFYQELMARRAYLGLPPYVAEFPPYDTQALTRAANL